MHKSTRALEVRRTHAVNLVKFVVRAEKQKKGLKLKPLTPHRYNLADNNTRPIQKSNVSLSVVKVGAFQFCALPPAE